MDDEYKPMKVKINALVHGTVKPIAGSLLVAENLSCLKRLVPSLCALGILTLTASAQMSGQLGLVDSSGNAAATYESGSKVYVKLTDSDGNADSAAVETIDVKITSDTEDKGDPFTASAVTADSGNTGDGTLEVLKTSYDTKTEDWTLMMINAQNKTFKVTGSVSGIQNKQMSMGSGSTEATYTSDGGEVTLKLTEGSVGFAVGDEFTFSTTAGTVVGETLTLTETGADTGIFEGNIELATGSVTAANSKLEVVSGDRVTVFYDDPKGDWGTALQVRDEALYAATVIKGSTYMKDVVWTKDDSPYLVTGDVTISSGRSLTIKEGVKVIFLANSDDTVGGEEKYDSELLVEGTISVLGTAAEPVTFTSSETAPSRGDWGGIRHKKTGCI